MKKLNKTTLIPFSYKPKFSFFSFFQKKDTYVDPRNQRLRQNKISMYVLTGIVTVSWIVIFKVWWGAEEICKKQYEALSKQDASTYRTVMENNKEREKNEIPEEYRPEYVNKKYFFYYSLI